MKGPQIFDVAKVEWNNSRAEHAQQHYDKGYKPNKASICKGPVSAELPVKNHEFPRPPTFHKYRRSR
ncbi:hypothetical protein GWI33_013933 [Rhynchophorus ferrugineus]|uniref:Uncharacterized protein n=1 Tax=Rhynchophorus ferrugineus TaxID=354439 RepID=A0A834IG29_RHYFE|nr:hypothetical protein GWI33_013933 [Rhynchophorus ferrugineus]